MTKEAQGIDLPTHGYHGNSYKLQVAGVTAYIEYQYDSECWRVILRKDDDNNGN